MSDSKGLQRICKLCYNPFEVIICLPWRVTKMDEAYKAIAANGQGLFSVAVAAYLLVRNEKRLQELTQVLTEMKVLLAERLKPEQSASNETK